MGSKPRLFFFACAALLVVALGGSAALGGPSAGSSKRVTKRVSVKDDFFRLKTVRIPRGSKVTWVTSGVDGHTVTFRQIPSGVGRIKGSGVLDAGDRFSHLFRKRGTYRYVCRIHEALGMKGRVIVE
jgi:plastocyanin